MSQKFKSSIEIDGSVTATTIIKSGGTASQFLKANGSVDSSTYLTAETDTLNSVTTRGGTTTNAITIGGLVVDGSLASGGTDYGYYQNGGTNIILKGDAQGRSGIFFQSEKNGTNINHPSDFGFIQFHSYGFNGTTGEANVLVLGVANDSTDTIVLQSPYNGGVKVGYKDATSGAGLTLQTIFHDAYHPNADTLTTARTLTIGSTGKTFNGSANVSWSLAEIGAAASSHTHSATDITSGTLADARLSGTYSGITLQTNGGNTHFTTPNTGSASTNDRTVFGLAQYKNDGSAAVGAIVFYAPNNTSSIMHRLRIEGMIYSGGPTMICIVQGYRTTGAWSNTSKVNLGIADVQVRFAVDAAGKNCVILGDVGTTWSYPMMAITHAMFSHDGVTDAYCKDWSVGLVTSLVGFTQLTATLGNSAISTNILGNAGTATSAATWTTARTITIGSTGKSVNGSGNVSWTLAEIGALGATAKAADSNLLDGLDSTYFDHRRYTDSTNYLGGHYVSGGTEKPNNAVFGAGKFKVAMLSGTNLGFGGTWNDVMWISTYTGGDVKSSHALVFDKYSSNVWVSDQNFDSASWGTGYLLITSANIGSQSVSSAATLTTARTINGTSFNGSADITTANWGTARTLTIGNTGKSVNGSGNVSWSLAEIGALPAAGGTLTGVLVVADGASIAYADTNGTYVPRPAGAYYKTTTATITGAMKITFPGDLPDDMFSFWVDVYDYASNPEGESVSLYIYGYAYTNVSPYWTNVGAIVLTDRTDRDYNVRFGWDGTNHCITIGETTSSWSYPQVNLRDLQAGYTASYTTFDNSISISFVTTLPTIGQTASANYVAAKTAQTLQTARTINGTSFNGSANITTANWGTARTLTIGNTGKSVNGSGNVSWSLAEIGALGATAKAADSNLLDGLDSTQFSRVYKGTASFSNATFVNAFNVTGDALASAVRFSVQGTANNVVINVVADLFVNHSGDILITTYSGFYTTLQIRVQSNGNEAYSVLLASNSANAATCNIEVFPLNSETITFGGTATTGTTLTHTAYFGTSTSGTGGNSGDIRTAGSFIGSLSGNASTATTLQTARTINGTSFNGSADITTANWGTARTINGVSINGSTNYTIEPYVERDDSTNALRYLTFVDDSTAAHKRLNMDNGLMYNPSTGTLISTLFSGTLSGAFNTIYGSQIIGSFTGSYTTDSSPQALLLSNTSGATAAQVMKIRTSSSTTMAAISFWNLTTLRGHISVTGSGTTYNSVSDYRLKENIIDLENASDRLMKLKPKRFSFIDGDGQMVDGFLAHEAQEVVPEAVEGQKDAVDENGNPAYQGIDQSKLIPLLTAALQDALKRIDQLEKLIQTK